MWPESRPSRHWRRAAWQFRSTTRPRLRRPDQRHWACSTMKMSRDCWGSDGRRQRILARRIECDQGLKTHIGLRPPHRTPRRIPRFFVRRGPAAVVQFLVCLGPEKQRAQPQWNREPPMLRSISDPPLLIPQSNHRIDARRMSRGHIACREGNHDKKSSRTTEGQ